MRFLFLMLLVELSFPLEVFPQSRVITGRMLDRTTGDALPFATIRDRDGKGIHADAAGKFTFSIPPGEDRYPLICSYTGYQSDTVFIESGLSEYTVRLSAQDKRLSDVVVTTGVSRAQSIKVNPVPVMVISAKTIDQTIGDNIIDALGQSAPGFNSVKTGPGVSKPFIHGLGYNRVLTLYDGVRQEGQQWGDEHGIVADDYNIERAEIIKGPASLMYGSDAIAGVLSLFPVMPYNTDGKLKGRFSSEYQSNNGLIGNGIRLIYGKNNWSFAVRSAFRVAKNYHDPVDGWVYNTNFRTSNVSFTSLYKTSSGYSSFNLNLYDHKQGIPDGSRDSLTRQFTKQVYETAGIPADDFKNRPLVPYDSLNSYLFSPLFQHIQDYKFYSNSHYSLGKGWLDGQVAFTQNFRTEFNHPTAPTQPGLSLSLFTINYGIRYSVRIFNNTEITLGLNGMYQKNRNLNATDFPIPDFNLFDAGPYLYLHRKFDRLAVSGGIRYDHRSIKGPDLYTAPEGSSGFSKQVSHSDTAGAYLQFPAFNKIFSGISFSLGITYQLNEHITLKANIARGFRAPNISEFASNGLDPGAHIVYLGNRNAKPEFSLQEDLGILYSDQNFSASISIFNNHIQDYLYQAQATDAQGNPRVIVPGNKTFQYDQASAQLFGFEATFNWHPVSIRGFSFDNALTMLNGYNRSTAYKNQGVQGEYLPFMPPTRWLTGVQQEWLFKSSLLNSITLKIQADINATQNHYLALNQTETASPGYTLMNFAMIANIQYSHKNALQFQLQVNNLLNTIYQSNQSRLKYFEYYNASPNGYLGIYGMGRNICLKMIMPF